MIEIIFKILNESGAKFKLSTEGKCMYVNEKGNKHLNDQGRYYYSEELKYGGGDNNSILTT